MPAIDPPPNPLVIENDVQRFVVAHYPSDADGVTPDVSDLKLYTYTCALERAAALMADADNEGICTIAPYNLTIIYPPSPLVDGFPA